jgi:hypothetical protein
MAHTGLGGSCFPVLRRVESEAFNQPVETVMETEGHGNRPPATGKRLKVSDAPEEARGQRQSAFRRVRRKPTTKGVAIYANPRGYDNFALV